MECNFPHEYYTQSGVNMQMNEPFLIDFFYELNMYLAFTLAFFELISVLYY